MNVNTKNNQAGCHRSPCDHFIENDDENEEDVDNRDNRKHCARKLYFVCQEKEYDHFVNTKTNNKQNGTIAILIFKNRNQRIIESTYIRNDCWHWKSDVTFQFVNLSTEKNKILFEENTKVERLINHIKVYNIIDEQENTAK